MADDEQEIEEENLEEDAPEVEEAPEPEPEPEIPIAGIGTLVFGKWDATEVTCSDPGIAPYVNLRTVGVPHSGGRHANQWFGKYKLSIVERFIKGLRRTGSYPGKKMATTTAFEQALDEISRKTGDNPLQVFVEAITNSAPMEEITRIRFGAVSQPKAVDSSPSRRMDTALRNLALGSTKATRKSKRTLTQGIVTEVLKASKGDVASFAVGKREELERVAAAAR
ncbi:MAG: 30S ribosomal protein S7 [Candidatus Poseidoniales archaeon]|nr:30S ribosomal protein S7 [Candidatus Poseidoniales archaeon]